MRLRAWTMLALAACAGDADKGDDTDDTDAGVAASVVIGTGQAAYEPLADGDPVTLVHGPQGGWHVETAGIVTGLPLEVTITPTIVVPGLGDLQIAGDQQPQFLALAEYDEASLTGTFWGVRAFVDDADPPPDGLDMQAFICSLEGQTLELSIAVSDILGGATATASVNVTAELDPSDLTEVPPYGCATP